jgi:hypothetical protein
MYKNSKIIKIEYKNSKLPPELGEEVDIFYNPKNFEDIAFFKNVPDWLWKLLSGLGCMVMIIGSASSYLLLKFKGVRQLVGVGEGISMLSPSKSTSYQQIPSTLKQTITNTY